MQKKNCFSKKKSAVERLFPQVTGSETRPLLFCQQLHQKPTKGHISVLVCKNATKSSIFVISYI